MSYDYDTYVTTMQQMLTVDDTDGQALFETILPRMVEYAELRIYRELDLIDTSGALAFSATAGNRNLAIPAGSFVVIEAANAITPAGAVPDGPGSKRVQLTRTSREWLDYIGGVSDPDVPEWYEVFELDLVILGPTPDQAYSIELVGTLRPAPLSADNTTTLLTTYFPDIFLSASMIFGAGYQHNFGAQADDPKMALSWEGIYRGQMEGAGVEEARKKAMAGNWQARKPLPTVPQQT